MSEIVSWIEEAKKEAVKFEEDHINISAHVIIEKEDDLYTAHCLEFDIVTEAKTIKDVKNNIIEAIINHVTFCLAYDNVDKIMNPAPKEYWDKFYFKSKKYSKPFKFDKNYSFNNVSLPFLNNMITEINFGKACANA